MITEFQLNGKPHRADTPPGATLLEYLRSIGLMGVKRGCEDGECGSCTVLLDGETANSCLIPVAAIAGRSVETVESLGLHGDLHPIQEAFLDNGAVQCGYCTPAMILAAEALLRKHPNPTEDQVREALSGILCRCTGYVKPVKAVLHTGQMTVEDKR